MIRKLDDFLNAITMYKVVVYSLALLVLASLVFSITGILDYDPIGMIMVLMTILLVGFVTNAVLQKIWKIPVNAESGLITCLILFFLISPIFSIERLPAIIAVTVIAIASKFILSYRGKHIFNPAAFGLFVVATIGIGSAAWWIGSAVLWPFVLVLGLIVARKIRKQLLVVAFLLTAVVGSTIGAVMDSVSVTDSLQLLIASSPLLFLGFYMLTEPSTMPSTRTSQYVFAIGTALLFSLRPEIGPIMVYPETALLIANVYAFAVSPKKRWKMRLISRKKVGEGLYDFEFLLDTPIKQHSGQYIELTAPLKKIDDRGNRRTFTLASAAHEKTARIGMRIPENPSAFKKHMLNMKNGDDLYAGQIAGNFTVDKESNKLLFIAGGVGVTPFRSILVGLANQNISKDIIMIYIVKPHDVFMYLDDLKSAATKLGITLICSDNEHALNAAIIQENVPDLHKRTVYVSGSPSFIRLVKRTIRVAGIAPKSIKTDYFSGY